MYIFFSPFPLSCLPPSLKIIIISRGCVVCPVIPVNVISQEHLEVKGQPYCDIIMSAKDNHVNCSSTDWRAAYNPVIVDLTYCGLLLHPLFPAVLVIGLTIKMPLPWKRRALTLSLFLCSDYIPLFIPYTCTRTRWCSCDFKAFPHEFVTLRRQALRQC